VRGVGSESSSVRLHRFRFFCSRFYSRFAPGFAPDSRSNSISLNHTRSGRIAHNFNLNIVDGLTPSLHIALLRRGLSKNRWVGILFMSSEANVKRETICL